MHGLGSGWGLPEGGQLLGPGNGVKWEALTAERCAVVGDVVPCLRSSSHSSTFIQLADGKGRIGPPLPHGSRRGLRLVAPDLG